MVEKHVQEFLNKKLILFGASSRGIRVLNNLVTKGFQKKNIVFCDNNMKKVGKKILGISIISLDDLKNYSYDTPIIISSSMFNEIKLQLTGLEFINVNYFHSLLFSNHKFEKFDSTFLKILDGVKEDCYMDDDEKFTIYSSLKYTNHLSGNVAEVGVYRGGSAKIICQMKGSKKLFLFDTFQGLPTISKKDPVEEGWLSDTSLEHVKEKLSSYKNVFFFKGRFPETTSDIMHEKFCFVHLDTDMFQSTLDSLEFFWPRMVKGGRIISHDFNAVDVGGVKEAFLEFFKDSKEKVIEIADTQVLVIK